MGQINCSEDLLYEKTLSSETKFEGRVFKVIVKQVELPSGKTSSREIVLHHGGACILPVDTDMNVYLIKQFRSPFEKVMLEAPAGKIEEGEAPLECATREITEETGFVAGKIEEIGKMTATPGYCSETISLYLATELEYKGGNPDDGEYLSLVKMPLKEALDMVLSGKIEDAKTQLVISFAARRFGI
ncbi:MAG: NUDIX hydrolase [Saccharofermentans sp.]|nr:NUDIX hydrolase [Saccharofermentans sp.]